MFVIELLNQRMNEFNHEHRPHRHYDEAEDKGPHQCLQGKVFSTTIPGMANQRYIMLYLKPPYHSVSMLIVHERIPTQQPPQPARVRSLCR